VAVRIFPGPIRSFCNTHKFLKVTAVTAVTATTVATMVAMEAILEAIFDLSVKRFLVSWFDLHFF
jgi:hypothetical protein